MGFFLSCYYNVYIPPEFRYVEFASSSDLAEEKWVNTGTKK
jgi:hypothetical protein